MRRVVFGGPMDRLDMAAVTAFLFELAGENAYPREDARCCTTPDLSSI